MKTRPFLFALLAALPLALTGCGVIYSKQYYGSPGARSISAESKKSDVLANLGVPNSIYEGENLEAFVYKYAEGQNILGLYATIEREDTVVIMDKKGVVLWVGRVPVGTGMTILAVPGLDATHPVRTETLLFDPENYSIETSGE
ncbi:MAG: hypothetical protein PWP23_3126 [Candidatus Sumerlaeota bacterium]|nr:hypothetical protein [Candidatus Sumerlaeota bacterium]